MDSRECERIVEDLNGFLGHNPDTRRRFWRLIFKMGENLVKAGPKLREIFETSSDLTERDVLNFLKENKIIPKQHLIKDWRASSSSSSVQKAPARRDESRTSQNLRALAHYERAPRKNREDDNAMAKMRSVQTERDDIARSVNRRHSDSDTGRSSQRQHGTGPYPSQNSQSQQIPGESWNSKNAMNLEEQRKQSRWGPPAVGNQKKTELDNQVSVGVISQPFWTSSSSNPSMLALTIYNPAQPTPIQLSVPTSIGHCNGKLPNSSSSAETGTELSKPLRTEEKQRERDPPGASGAGRRSGSSFHNRGNRAFAPKYSSKNEELAPARRRTSVVMKFHPKSGNRNRLKINWRPNARYYLRCLHCRRIFARPDGLRQHIKNKICRGKHYLCKICPDGSGNIYASMERLQKHWKQAHDYE